jgi:hypothetical protein
MSALVHILANASDVIKQGANAACGTSCNTSTVPVVFGKIADALVFLVGAVSVIMIILGGFRYVISNGDAKRVAAAKDTIMYAVIGLVVAIVAFAIVRFVANNI